jgi:hypothetical protein
MREQDNVNMYCHGIPITSYESFCSGHRNLATQAEEEQYVLNCSGQGENTGMFLLLTCCIRSASLDLDVEVF